MISNRYRLKPSIPFSLLFLAVLIELGAGLGLTAAEPPPPREIGREAGSSSFNFNLDAIPERVSSHNLQLQAARKQVEESQGRIEQAGKLSNPFLTAQYLQDPRVRELGGMIGFNQRIPVTNRREVERLEAAADKLGITASIADLERRLLQHTLEQAIHYLALAAKKEVVTEQRQLASDLATSIRQAADIGEASEIDVARVDLAATQFALETHHIDHELDELEGLLKPLLNVPPTAKLTISGGLPHTFTDPSYDNDPIEDRPDLKALRANLQKSKYSTERARLGQWQDITVGLFASHNREEDAPIGFEMEHRAGIQLSIPLPFWNKNEGTINERKAKSERLVAHIRALELEIETEIETARRAMKTFANHHEEIVSELMPKAKDYADKTQAAYHSGLTDLETNLSARHQFHQMTLRGIEALRDYHLARTTLSSALGLRFAVAQKRP